MSDTSAVDTSTTPSEPVASSSVAPTSTERPAWLPEKFNSAEDLAKAYAALEKRQGAASEPSGQQQAQQPATDAPPAASLADAQTMTAEAGFNYADLQAEFSRDGQLSQATYDALARAGITSEMVNSHIAGQQAIANQIRNDVLSAAGGEEAYTDMVAWAKDNMSADEIDAYNATMNAGNTAQMKLAVDGLKSRFTAAVGSTPKLLSGHSGQGGQASGDAFRSMADLTTAMKDPRYASDPAYRNEVRDRLARSNIM